MFTKVRLSLPSWSEESSTGIGSSSISSNAEPTDTQGEGWQRRMVWYAIFLIASVTAIFLQVETVDPTFKAWQTSTVNATQRRIDRYRHEKLALTSRLKSQYDACLGNMTLSMGVGESNRTQAAVDLLAIVDKMTGTCLEILREQNHTADLFGEMAFEERCAWMELIRNASLLMDVANCKLETILTIRNQTTEHEEQVSKWKSSAHKHEKLAGKLFVNASDEREAVEKVLLGYKKWNRLHKAIAKWSGGTRTFQDSESYRIQEEEDLKGAINEYQEALNAWDKAAAYLLAAANLNSEAEIRLLLSTAKVMRNISAGDQVLARMAKKRELQDLKAQRKARLLAQQALSSLDSFHKWESTIYNWANREESNAQFDLFIGHIHLNESSVEELNANNEDQLATEEKTKEELLVSSRRQYHRLASLAACWAFMAFCSFLQSWGAARTPFMMRQLSCPRQVVCWFQHILLLLVVAGSQSDQLNSGPVLFGLASIAGALEAALCPAIPYSCLRKLDFEELFQCVAARWSFSTVSFAIQMLPRLIPDLGGLFCFISLFRTICVCLLIVTWAIFHYVDTAACSDSSVRHANVCADEDGTGAALTEAEAEPLLLPAKPDQLSSVAAYGTSTVTVPTVLLVPSDDLLYELSRTRDAGISDVLANAELILVVGILIIIFNRLTEADCLEDNV